ncbi:GD24013 [Drosophila simulans]|uniref:GD24013 n=1 Tax=Drosophila simulans TaxID=7240 RepID=B4Q6F8_DROSI|nr:GD24013 [Drosophila simulans]
MVSRWGRDVLLTNYVSESHSHTNSLLARLIQQSRIYQTTHSITKQSSNVKILKDIYQTRFYNIRHDTLLRYKDTIAARVANRLFRLFHNRIS